MSYAIVLVQKRQLTAVALLLTMKSSLGTRLQIDSHSAVMERSMEASFPKKRLFHSHGGAGGAEKKLCICTVVSNLSKSFILQYLPKVSYSII